MSPAIRVWLAKPSDFDKMANIAVQAHVKDEKFAYLFAKRDSHPDAYRTYFRTHIKHHSMIPQCFLLVAEIEQFDGKLIAGYCLWNRDGEDEATVQKWGKKEAFLQSKIV
jgi:hypothetical protein